MIWRVLVCALLAGCATYARLTTFDTTAPVCCTGNPCVFWHMDGPCPAVLAATRCTTDPPWLSTAGCQ